MKNFDNLPFENGTFAHPPVPHHHIHGPHQRIEPFSIVPNVDVLENAFGEMWPYQLEAISREPAEMKLLFALQLGLKVNTNYNIDRLPACRFENPILNDEIMQKLEDMLGAEKDILFSVLDYAPPGVVAIICATVRNK